MIPAIIAGASALGSLAVGAYNSYQQSKANSVNNDLARRNYELNLDTLDFNKKMAERDFNYNKQLQETIFQREDSAVQRMVADNRLAGLSPIAGLSGSGTGQALEANTPQLTQNIPAPQMSANQLLMDFSSLGNLANTLQSEKYHKDDLEIQQQKLELEKSSNEANIRKMEEQIKATQIETAFKKATLDSRIEGSKLANQKAQQEIAKITADTIRSQLGSDYQRIVNAKSKQELQEFLDNIDSRAEIGKLDLERAKIACAMASIAKDQSEGRYTAEMQVLEEQLTKLNNENSRFVEQEAFYHSLGGNNSEVGRVLLGVVRGLLGL